jgi:uncharacterized membrane protein
MSRYRTFIVLLLALDVVAVAGGALLANVLGVDPLLAVGVPLLIVPVVAYWLAYRTDLGDDVPE